MLVGWDDTVSHTFPTDLMAKVVMGGAVGRDGGAPARPDGSGYAREKAATA
jgi:hypothetical protein